MSRQQFGFQLPKKACRMLGYIFLPFSCNFSLMFYNRCLLQVCHHSFKGPSFSNKATMPRQQFRFQLSALSRPFCILLTALFYYSLEFYNRQLLQIFPSLLSVTVAHYGIVVLSATFLRLVWVMHMTDKRRNFPNWSHYLKHEVPSVIAWALDIVCSISYLVYITLLSLSTMTTFIRISTITVFAIVFALKQWNDIPQTLVGIVPLFTRWLLLYTFESRESIAEELVLALFVSGLSGLCWAIAQILAQKQEADQRALEEIQQLKDENDRVKREKCQRERERLDLLAHKNNVEKELCDTRQKLELVSQNIILQRDIEAKEALVHELKTKHTRLEVQKHRLEKEMSDVQEENDKLVLQNHSLQTDLTAKESQVHELAHLTTAQQEEIKQLESEKNRLLTEKYQTKKKERDPLVSMKSQHQIINLVDESNALETHSQEETAKVPKLNVALLKAKRAPQESSSF